MQQMQLWPDEQEVDIQGAIWERIESGDQSRLLELLSQVICKTAKELNAPEKEVHHEPER
jgi:hypothetical protein